MLEFINHALQVIQVDRPGARAILAAQGVKEVIEYSGALVKAVEYEKSVSSFEWLSRLMQA